MPTDDDDDSNSSDDDSNSNDDSNNNEDPPEDPDPPADDTTDDPVDGSTDGDDPDAAPDDNNDDNNGDANDGDNADDTTDDPSDIEGAGDDANQNDTDTDSANEGDSAADNQNEGDRQDQNDNSNNSDNNYSSDGDAGPPLDASVFGSQGDYPNSQAEDFENDNGDWSTNDYLETSQKLFGDHEFFGDSAHQQRLDNGWQRVDNHDDWMNSITQFHPDAAESVGFYHRDGKVSALGFITTAALALLRDTYPDMDLDNLHTTIPDDPNRLRREPDQLPASLQSIDPADKVDLRTYCSPVGDQGQTSRCAAFAWTHSVEMSGPMLGRAMPRLSCSYTMMQFQKKQGDWKDYKFAWAGGDGTGSEAEPGPTLAAGGTCNHDHWPNDEKQPRVSDADMARDALAYRLPAAVSTVDIEDLKKVLTAGHPVVLGMNTGGAFSDLGRDGIVHAAEEPSGRHGRHAMLMVGYIGNYFIVKNSWGDEWGDNGYCYIPKKVLQAAEAEFQAVLIERGAPAIQPVQPNAIPAARPVQPMSSAAAPAPAARPMAPAAPRVAPVAVGAPPPAAPATAVGLVRCAGCGNQVRPGRFCERCGHALAAPVAPAKRFCANCGGELKPTDHFCFACGTRAQ